MVSHRLLSISAVFGGKNSKEIAGWLCARDVAGAGVRSLMTFDNLRNKAGAARNAAFLAKNVSSQDM